MHLIPYFRAIKQAWPLCFTIENGRRLVYALDSVLSSYKASMAAEADEKDDEDDIVKQLSVNDGMFNGCIATSIQSSNRRKRSHNVAVEHNSHLFAPESPSKGEDEEDDDKSTPSEEEWTHDAKKAREEFEQYEDVD